MQKKPSKLTVISLLSSVAAAPAVVFLCIKLIEGKSYYAAAVLVIVCAVLPFFVYFENRKIKTAEIVLLAVMTALAVASRSVMMFLPQVKPTAAIVIITAAAFGANCGFLTGTLSMFLSNFIFGQGIFTPFQMLGMGLTGFICGLIFHRWPKICNRFTLSITGGFLTFFVYGLCADMSSVFMFSGNLSLKSISAIYLSGLGFNIIHGISTAIILFFITKPMTEKFSRLRKKYGIFQST